jgi:hypothetical protein
MMTDRDLADIEGKRETSDSGRESDDVGNNDGHKHVSMPIPQKDQENKDLCPPEPSKDSSQGERSAVL